MNLDQITTKCWILALFIRDDGERLLLGDGWFDFKDSLQHFQPNSIANDIVELQGTDGQLLAGQVRRSASQSFDGYIGDALTSKTEIENRRRQFIQFFRTRRHYKVIYVFPDGTAIQRRMGYLTDAPSVPEMWQKFPEYHVALNFEDVNYYEYAEDAQGDEIYAHDSLVKLISVQSGGLVWDEYGAVSHGYTWLDPQTVTGDYITVTNGMAGAPLSLAELDGNATQTTYSGKNLFSGNFSQFDNTGGTGSVYSYFKLPDNGTYTLTLKAKNNVSAQSAQVFLGFSFKGGESGGGLNWVWTNGSSASAGEIRSIQNVVNGVTLEYVSMYANNAATLQWFTTNFEIQLEAGSPATAYEPYVGGSASPNPDYPQAIETVTGEQTVKVTGKNLLGEMHDNFGINATDGTVMQIAGRFALVARIQEGQTYTASRSAVGASTYFWVGFFAEKPVVGSQSIAFSDMGISALQRTITAPSGAKYCAIFYGAELSPDCQLEAGSQASDYQPYQGQEFEVNLASIELAKIGNYQDRIYKTDGKWYIEKNVGKVVLDGTESGWGYNSTRKVFWGFNANLLPDGGFTLQTLGYWAKMCDNFTYYAQSGNDATLPDGLYENTATSSQSQLLFHLASVTSLADWKTWLGTHPTTVYYALATPTTTEITDETLLAQLNFIASLYGGVNNISIVPSAGAQGQMTLNYYADVDTTGAGYEWEAGEGGGPTIVQVIGVDNAQPIWTVTGPATNPTLTNITTVQSITWNGTVPNGQKLIVDMANQTATLAGANVYEFITGSWITLRPGANKLTYSAQGADQASQIQWNGVVG